MCPDPDLTSNNCDGETSTAQIGNDLGSGTPNKRLVVVKRDNRTIVNDDALTAPGNNGDLPGGLKVNLCGEDTEQGFPARVTTGNGAAATTPALTQGGTAAVPLIAGANVANAIRMQQDGGGNDCGLLVSPPRFTAIGASPRQSIAYNQANGANDPTVDGLLVATVKIENTDTERRLFRVKGRWSLILEIDQNNGAPEPINLAQIIYSSKLDDNPVFGGTLAPAGVQRFVGGGDNNSRVATIVHPEGNFAGFTVNDQREFVDEVIVDVGDICYIHYYTRTIRLRNFKTTGQNFPQPFRGVNIVGVSVEDVYAVGGA